MSIESMLPWFLFTHTHVASRLQHHPASAKRKWNQTARYISHYRKYNKIVLNYKDPFIPEERDERIKQTHGILSPVICGINYPAVSIIPREIKGFKPERMAVKDSFSVFAHPGGFGSGALWTWAHGILLKKGGIRILFPSPTSRCGARRP